MSQLLEATMLICFGFSWPMSVVKNIKARTAKSMSLPFILLIITGYLAGIVAKLSSNTINYVLIVYFINLAIVSINVGVYFINRRYDKQSEATQSDVQEEEAQMAIQPITDLGILAEMRKYEQMNLTEAHGGMVLFGANYCHALDAETLAHEVGMEGPVCNRSLEHLPVDQACNALDACVFQLDPSRVFINLGDEDVLHATLNPDQFIEQYQWLLYRLHSRTHAKLYIVSVVSSLPAAQAINERLSLLAQETGCAFLDAGSITTFEQPAVRLFELIRAHARDGKITFADAMELGARG